jgi:hypothetical protein
MRLSFFLGADKEKGQIKELTTAFFGNYTVQDLLDAAHKLRLAAAKLREQGNMSKEAVDALLDMEEGQDALGTLPSKL